ncbi:hypothetical protein PsorP6_017562 [Peronosclerospora sorghi]|uniref:Uncharacterized protein n=1 Tax=Peronosclerospora sorghi TaxID=230839 RepID=A0ACC0WLT4_9STRA|nr:hypothetical protein PsorP6_017562 [Peronosclerospora sorghi]
MKLQLILTIVICTRFVLAKSTSEVQKHMPLLNATQDTSPVSRNLMPVTFAERWAETVDEGIREAFAAYEWEAYLEKINAKKSELENTQSIDWRDLNLLRGEEFYQRVVLQNCPPKDVFKELDYHNDPVRLVKIINIGKRSIDAELRSYASELEELLIQEWKTELNLNARALYQLLELDKLTSEKALYVNPAFATWLKFAQVTYKQSWRFVVALVLDHFQASALFVIYRGETPSEVEELLLKWDIVLQKAEKWHEIVEGDTESREIN